MPATAHTAATASWCKLVVAAVLAPTAWGLMLLLGTAATAEKLARKTHMGFRKKFVKLYWFKSEKEKQKNICDRKYLCHEKDFGRRKIQKEIQLLKLFEKTCPRPAHVDQAQVQPRDQLRHALFYIGSDKGQLISECLFGDINFPKNQRKNLTNFCPGI